MMIVVASLAFALIYLLIACQGPRVWRLTSSSGLRLLGVLCVQLIAVAAGLLVFMLMALSVAAQSDDGSARVLAPAAGARSLMLPLFTVLFSFVGAIAHWVRHGSDQEAKAATGVNKFV
jgi:hypothetical protein